MTKMMWSFILAAALAACFYIFWVDGTYRTPVQAIELARSLDEPIDVVREHQTEEGEVIFYLRYIHPKDPKPVVSADYVKKAFIGWKWVTGGGHTLTETVEGKDEQERLDAAWSVQRIPGERGTPFPVFFGAVLNPEIAAVTVTDVKTGNTKPAEIFHAGADMRIWYWFEHELSGAVYTLQAMSADGEVLSSQQWEDKPYHVDSNMREEGLK
ncbi:hypothetical protein P9847_01525 [Paenibacillus chibensis]|uniref:Uncharacterized protein n=1 Tax=Paenibacillus chibensis TaxID=59846 RepID=A0ABU6PNM5_9BACL|nr:hypothetical protein [Paenibacillus chibensis]